MKLIPNFNNEGLIKNFKSDKLNILEYDNRDLLGRAAAETVANLMRKVITEKNKVRMVFASAMSQTDFLAYLSDEKDIDWSKVYAFHLDNYKDFPSDHKESFSQFLIDRLFNKTEGVNFFPINSSAKDSEAEVKRYSALLEEAPIDIMILGIGESGHIAFIDPSYCDFKDPVSFKTSKLDQETFDQLVHDGCFDKPEDVPKEAYTMTAPACTSGAFTIIIVPTALKAEAIKKVVEGPVTEKVPSSVLQTTDNAWLLIDKDSGKLLSK